MIFPGLVLEYPSHVQWLFQNPNWNTSCIFQNHAGRRDFSSAASITRAGTHGTSRKYHPESVLEQITRLQCFFLTTHRNISHSSSTSSRTRTGILYTSSEFLPEPVLEYLTHLQIFLQNTSTSSRTLAGRHNTTGYPELVLEHPTQLQLSELIHLPAGEESLNGCVSSFQLRRNINLSPDNPLGISSVNRDVFQDSLKKEHKFYCANPQNFKCK